MDLISLLYDKINELVKHQTERDKGHDKKKLSFALIEEGHRHLIFNLPCIDSCSLTT
jgi:hypothetical protein